MASPKYIPLDSIQLQVEEVRTIMKNNLDKVLERDDKIIDLVDKSDQLKNNSNRFEKTAIKLRKNMRCKNIKYMIIFISIVLILILILILSLIIWSKN